MLLCNEEMSSSTFRETLESPNKALKCTSHFWWVINSMSGWLCPVGVVNTGCSNWGYGLTLSTRLDETCVLPARSRGKEGPSSIKGKAEERTGFFIAPVGFIFLVDAAPISCQRFLGSVTSLISFLFLFFLLTSTTLYYVNKLERQILYPPF